MNPHTTNDDPRRYQLGSERETWKLRDPIERVRAYLTREVRIGQDFFNDVEQEAKKLAEHLRSGCRALPDPSAASVFENVHVTMPEELVAQRAEFEEFVSAVNA
jgi:pyruvate dehydrogenase E1 component alpha subunit